jgi:hypothetical protein
MAQCDLSNAGGDVWQGPTRMPRNSAQHVKGSIHDDATAQKLGFRGGTVAGSLHMEQFPPLLVHLLGEQWWESGGLSLYFRYATTDLEPVRCMAVAPQRLLGPGLRHIEVWMEHSKTPGDPPERVADGTASVGGVDCGSALRQRLGLVPEPTELRILAGLAPQASCRGVPTRIDAAQLASRLPLITEPMPAYEPTNRWGRAVLPPSLLVRALRVVEPALLARPGPVVGLFGAIEIQHLNGPAFVDTDYVADGRVLAISDTPKTEYVWYEAVLTDAAEGTAVASMLMMLRFMKVSSPLWQSGRSA